MIKLFKIIIWIAASLAFVFVALLLAYVIANKQEVIEPFQVGAPQSPYKILIASQGSEFKEALVDSVINNLKGDSVFISVVDCTYLQKEHLTGYNAWVIVHTMQIHKMPTRAFEFLQMKKDLSNVVLVSTSGGGDDHFTRLDVDGISSASFLSNISPVTNWVVPRVKNILYSNLGYHWEEPEIHYKKGSQSPSIKSDLLRFQ